MKTSAGKTTVETTHSKYLTSVTSLRKCRRLFNIRDIFHRYISVRGKQKLALPPHLSALSQVHLLQVSKSTVTFSVCIFTGASSTGEQSTVTFSVCIFTGVRSTGEQSTVTLSVCIFICALLFLTLKIFRALQCFRLLVVCRTIWRSFCPLMFLTLKIFHAFLCFRLLVVFCTVWRSFCALMFLTLKIFRALLCFRLLVIYVHNNNYKGLSVRCCFPPWRHLLCCCISDCYWLAAQ